MWILRCIWKVGKPLGLIALTKHHLLIWLKQQTPFMTPKKTHTPHKIQKKHLSPKKTQPDKQLWDKNYNNKHLSSYDAIEKKHTSNSFLRLSDTRLTTKLNRHLSQQKWIPKNLGFETVCVKEKKILLSLVKVDMSSFKMNIALQDLKLYCSWKFYH